MANSNYVFYNPNPKQRYFLNGEPMKWHGCDCAVRSLAKLENMDWVGAYQFLYQEGLANFMMPNDDALLDKVYKKLGYVRGSFKSKERIRLNDFIKKHPKGGFAVRTPSHICAVVNGKIYDTWDCGNRFVSSWWEKKIDD